MEEFTIFENSLIDISDEILRDRFRGHKDDIFMSRLEGFVTAAKNLVLDFCDEDINSVAVLYAHGSGESGRFNYHDNMVDPNKANLSVQDWIDKVDGKSDAIAINSCNEGFARVHSRKSHLVYAKKYIMYDDMGMSLRKEYRDKVFHYSEPITVGSIIPIKVMDKLVKNPNYILVSMP